MRRGAKGGGAKDEREVGGNDEGEERRGNEGYKRASYIVETLYAGNGHPFVDIEGGKNCRCTRVRCRYNQFTDFHRKNDVEKRHKTQGQSRGPRIAGMVTHVTSTAPLDTTCQSVIKALPFFVHSSEL
jgi:hypothetical protein